MTNKFIAVSNKQEADRAAKYLEHLGYSAYKCEAYSDEIQLLYTNDRQYSYSDYTASEYIENWKDEQIFIPDDFDRPAQEPKEEYVLSGVWQYYSPDDSEWITDSNQNRYTRQLIESQGVKTRDLYIKA